MYVYTHNMSTGHAVVLGGPICGIDQSGYVHCGPAYTCKHVKGGVMAFSNHSSLPGGSSPAPNGNLFLYYGGVFTIFIPTERVCGGV